MKIFNSSQLLVIGIITAILIIIEVVLAPSFFTGAISIAFIAGAIITGWLDSSNDSSSSLSQEERSSTEATTLYIGNIPYKADEKEVKALFQAHAQVKSLRLVRDKRTGKRKGYGFIEIVCNDIDNVISTLHEHEFQSRSLVVRLAQQKAVS